MATTTKMAITTGRAQQRMQALERANAVRRRRAELKRQLKAGSRPIEEVLVDPPGYLASATMLDLLTWTPKRQRARANDVLLRCRISPGRLVGELTQRQRQVILAELRRSSA